MLAGNYPIAFNTDSHLGASCVGVVKAHFRRSIIRDGIRDRILIVISRILILYVH